MKALREYWYYSDTSGPHLTWVVCTNKGVRRTFAAWGGWDGAEAYMATLRALGFRAA